MNSVLMTVTGAVSRDETGMIDGHNHVWITGQSVQTVDAPVLDQPAEIAAELSAYKDAGGWGQIDCQPGGSGRDGVQLRTLSQATGVKIVANTGFHLQQYYPEGAKIWGLDASEAKAYFISEIKEGLEETRLGEPVYPGLIKIAVQASLEKSPRHLIEAAIAASIETDYLIEMHTERGQDIENVLAFMLERALAPERLVICHIDKRPDIGLHKELAREGYGLEYDTFFRSKYAPEKYLWPLIEEMAAAGYTHNLVLATDLADQSLWAFGGGVGLNGFVDKVCNRLKKIGFSSEEIKAMTGGNIADRLAIKDKEI